jgi:hypothetical protein
VRARRNRGEDRGWRWTWWKRITPTVPRDPELGGEASRRRGAQTRLVGGPLGVVERGHGQRGSGRDGGGGTEGVERGEEERKERGADRWGRAIRERGIESAG